MLLFAMLITACDKTEEDDFIVSAECSTVTIQAKTPDVDQEGIHVYIFGKAGKLVEQSLMSSPEESPKFDLPPGDYTMLCLTGVPENLIPEKPDLETCIKGVPMPATKPITYARHKFKVERKPLNLKIQLYYITASIEFNLSGLKKAKNVEVEITDTFTGFTIIGKYINEGKSTKIKCHKEGDLWKSDKKYILPTEEAPSCIINVENENNKESYTYKFQEKIKHKYPYIINGNYIGNFEFVGDFVSPEWKNPIKIDFEFGNVEEAETEE